MRDESHKPDRPILFVDVDGVVSLYGWERDAQPAGSFFNVEGILHLISESGGRLLARLTDRFELVWATGWEERANEYLPHLLELPFRDLPTLTFDGRAVFGTAHWKLEAIDEYAGDRPAAWIDDNLNKTCHMWAKLRRAPTLLVETDPSVGLTDEHVEQLLGWAAELKAPTRPDAV